MPRPRTFSLPLVLTVATAMPGCGPRSSETGPDPAAPHREWSVWLAGDGECQAGETGLECPEGLRCNPPPPTKIACPDGMTGDAHRRVVQLEAGAECLADPPAICEADCVPRPTPCPEE